MTALVAANVTVTVEKRAIEGPRKRNRVKLVFGDGALTYPTGGVPLPAKASYGMAAFLESLDLLDDGHANGFVYKYDRDNNKLVIYTEFATAGAVGANQPLTEATTALAPAATTIIAEAVGW